MSIYTWGHGEFGQLGANVSEKAFTPTILNWRKSDQVVSIAVGSCHTLLLTNDGEVYAMGDNSCGQLGLGDRENRLEPTRIEAFTTMSKPIAISCGTFHSAVILEDGNVVLFGAGSCGQLGNGRTTDSLTPRVLKSFRERRRHVVQVAAGQGHTLFLLRRGHVYALGANDRGQLGHGDTEMRTEPSFVRALLGVPVVHIAAGDAHSVALTATGEVITWGCNKYGQLGTGSTKTSLYPQVVSTFGIHTPATAIACGGDFTAALSKDGKLWVWGQGSRGQLGLGGTGHVNKPRAVEWFTSKGRKVTDIQLGTGHAIATAHMHSSPDQLELYAWGSGDSGVLGNGDPQDKSIPTLIASPLWTTPLSQSISTGGDHALVVRGSNFKALGLHVSHVASSQVAMSGKDVLDVFSSPSCVNSSLISDSGSRQQVKGKLVWRPFDPQQVEDFYNRLINQEVPEFALDLLDAMQKAIQSFQSLWKDQQEPSVDILPASLRFLLIFLQSPVFSVPRVSHLTLKALCTLLMSLKPQYHVIVAHWISCYPSNIFGSRLVRMLQAHVDFALAVTPTAEGAIAVAQSILWTLQFLSHAAPKGFNRSEFYNKNLSQTLADNKPFLIHEVELIVQRKAPFSMTSMGDSRPSICELAPAILTAEVKHMLFKVETIMRLTTEGRTLPMAALGVNVVLQQVVKLSVRRDHLVQDAIIQVCSQLPRMRDAMLIVEFQGEEGQDEGGPRREFFQLLLHELFNENYGMFRIYEDTRVLYPRGDPLLCSPQDFFVLGALLAAAYSNDVLLDLNFPPIIYDILIRPWKDEALWDNVTLDDLRAIDPQLANGLQQLQDFDGDVEDTFNRTFTVDVESLGTVTTVPLKPRGENIPVTRGNREEYIHLYLRWFLLGRCEEQLHQLYLGFRALYASRLIATLHRGELETLLCGTKHMNFADLRKSAKYDGGYGDESPVIQWFWQVLLALPFSEQIKFLSFLTGCSRAPIGGLEKLSIKIQRSGDDVSRLPVAHTCFNLLDLPEYQSREQLKDKLLTAVHNTEGFGLL